MNEDEKIAFDKWLDELPRDASAYEPRPGDQSLFAGFSSFFAPQTREEKLAQPIRAITIDWLAWELASAGQRSFYDARKALVNAIPFGSEGVLDDGMTFLEPFDLAAFALGIDPYTIMLRPIELHS